MEMTAWALIVLLSVAFIAVITMATLSLTRPDGSEWCQLQPPTSNGRGLRGGVVPFDYGALYFHRSPATFAVDGAGNSLRRGVFMDFATDAAFRHCPDDTVTIDMHAHRQHEPVPPENCREVENIGTWVEIQLVAAHTAPVA
jgi:hypothetical protein